MRSVELTPFRIERWYERYEFTTELMLSSSDCESVAVSDLLALEPDARERLDGLRLGYTEVPGSDELRAAIAALYDRTTPDDVVSLAAAEEGIFVVEHAVLGPGAHAIVETPCYESALAVARSTGADVDEWRRSYADGWEHDVEALERLLRPDTRLVYVNTPHNPTGLQMPRPVLDRIVELCAERDAVLLCDEVYRELEHDPADRLPAACDLYERAVSLGTVSKTYGLPGLRTGWIACRDAALREAVVATKLYTTICSSAPSELLAALALRHRERLADRNRALVLENLALADAFLAAHQGLARLGPADGVADRVPAPARRRHACVLRAARRRGGRPAAPGRGLRRAGPRALRPRPPPCRRGVRAPHGLRRAGLTAQARVEVLRDEPEQHAVDPLVVAPVRLAPHALADPPGALGVPERALVEPVDLHLDPMEAEVAEEVTLDRPSGLDADALPPEARVDREPADRGDPRAPVHALPGRRPRRFPVDLDDEHPERLGLALGPLDLLGDRLLGEGAHGREEGRDVLAPQQTDEVRHVRARRAAERDAHRAVA